VLSPREIKAIDREGLSEAYTRWPESMRRSLNQPLRSPDRREFSSVVLGGMGGSGSACDILSDWLRPRIRLPVTVTKDYDLPGFAGPKTLCVIVSLSGETKETHALLRQAVEKGCSAVSVSSGGALEGMSNEMGVPFNRVENLLVPRVSVPGMVVVAARLMVKLGMVEGEADLEEAVNEVTKTLSSTSASVAFERNPSKKLAKALLGRSVVVYSSPASASVAYHFKASMNENAKVPVQVETYPELFHNEIETWVAGRNRALVMIRRKHGEEIMEQRLSRLEELLKKVKIPMADLWLQGSGMGALLSCSLELDLASVYLAVLKGRAPAPTRLVQQMRPR